MATGTRSMTGEAVSDPGSIRLYLAYRSLPANELGNICVGMARLYNSAVRLVSGGRAVTFQRGDERIAVRAHLNVEEIRTGNSIEIKFAEGWTPSIGIEDKDLVIHVPKHTAIPLIVAFALLKAADAYQDFRLKGADLQLKQIEIQLKQHDLDKQYILEDERLQRQSDKVITRLIRSRDIYSFKVNEAEIKPQ